MALDWTQIAVALITFGLLKYIADGIAYLVKRRRAKQESATPDAQHAMSLATVDQSLAIVAKARDELESDNAMLRAMLAEERAQSAHREADLIQRHAAERSTWDMERVSLRTEIADLERRLREMLREVEGIRRRTDLPDTGPMRAIRA